MWVTRPTLGLPQMQLVARRLEPEMQPRARAQVELELVRRAGCGTGDGAGKAAVDRTVQVAADDALDLRVTRNDLGKGADVLQAIPVHVVMPVAKGGWCIITSVGWLGAAASVRIEPAEPLGAQNPAVFARDRGVERDEAQRIFLDRVWSNPSAGK